MKKELDNLGIIPFVSILFNIILYMNQPVTYVKLCINRGGCIVKVAIFHDFGGPLTCKTATGRGGRVADVRKVKDAGV